MTQRFMNVVGVCMWVGIKEWQVLWEKGLKGSLSYINKLYTIYYYIFINQIYKYIFYVVFINI